MQLSLEEVAPILARSRLVQKHVREAFDKDQARRVLAKMRAGDFDGPDGLRADAFLVDQIPNQGELVWKELFEGEWPISVVCYGGVYLIQAVDHDDIGYFESEDDAVDFARSNWLGL